MCVRLRPRHPVEKSALTGGIITVTMPTIFTRLLSAPTNSIFLLGPRGTGKSSWIRQRFQDATIYDLLDTAEALRLSKDPSMLYRETETLAQDSNGGR